MWTTEPIGENCKFHSVKAYVVPFTGDASYTAVKKLLLAHTTGSWIFDFFLNMD